jgi:hypothetical protein
MNRRFVLGVYASPATENLRPTLGEYHRRFQNVDVQTVDCGQDTLQIDLPGSAIDLAVMTTNGRPGQIGRDHSTRGRIRRLLRSTALAVALGYFLPLPMPVTGIVFDPAAYADPYTGAIPEWIRSACCGPADVHRLAIGQVQEVDAAWALRLRPNANKDAIRQRDTYYVIEDYDYPLDSRSPSVNSYGVSSRDQYVWAFYRDGHPPSGMFCLFIPAGI